MMEKIIKIEKFEHTELWEQIIDQWIDNNLQYMKKVDNDCIYWHNERANVGALLVAIWQIGGVGTIEFEAIKKIQRNEKIQEKEGQIDLYFQSNDGVEFFVEAKFLRDKQDKSIKSSDIRQSMTIALKDSEASSAFNAVKNNMSLVFIASTEKQAQEIELICNDTYEEIKGNVKLKTDDVSYNGVAYNTVYLLGKYTYKDKK